MGNKLIFAVALSALPFSASAQWVAGAGYANFSADIMGWGDAKLGALIANVGYRLPMSEMLVLVPEVRVGFGLGEDAHSLESTEFDIDGSGQTIRAEANFELDTYYALALRAQLELNSSFYAYAVPSFAKVQYAFSVWDTFSVGRFSGSSESDWEFGIGAGAGYQFNDFLGAEVSYEVVDEMDMLTVQARFRF